MIVINISPTFISYALNMLYNLCVMFWNWHYFARRLGFLSFSMCRWSRRSKSKDLVEIFLELVLSNRVKDLGIRRFLFFHMRCFWFSYFLVHFFIHAHRLGKLWENLVEIKVTYYCKQSFILNKHGHSTGDFLVIQFY